jgi:hypothetical protein
MADVVQFPGPGTPPEDRPEDEIHAEAFRDLEGHISDCVCMGKIATDLMANTKTTDSKLAFAVFHLTEMLLNLEKHYMAASAGGDALGYRLILHPAKTSQETKEACGSLPDECEIRAMVRELLQEHDHEPPPSVA